MKKITFYLMMLLSITAFSQIEIVEDFDALTNGTVPTGWTANQFGASSTFACGGTGNVMSTAFTAEGESRSVTTNDFVSASNGTDVTVSFSYKIYQSTIFRPTTYSAPAVGWGSLVLEYSIDSGANWTTITTIDDSNYTYVDPETCTDSSIFTLTGITAGSNFQARFSATATTISSNFLIVDIDNVSITAAATTVPNCDAVITTPATGVNPDLDLVLEWSKATGLPTGYVVSVGTTSGGTDIVNAASTSTRSYDLTGLLAFNTEYFVNIVPTNAVGSATGCTEQTFTTRATPIDGATCSKPIVISSFPYLATDDTANYEDNIDVSPCSNSYMSGKDVFYQITPTSDMSINISLTNVSNTGASIHVVEGCPDSATECVAYVGVSSATAARELNEVVLLSGKTYFIVLSNSGATRTYTYNLFISQNSCVNPTFALAPVADCDNGQFSVDVDVTYMGSATTLTLSDDYGTTADVPVSATGTVTVGPYPTGSLVNFTLTNDQDGTCSYSDSVYFYCPPSNDECSNAIGLSVNTDGTNTLFTSATNAGATESVSDASSCGNNTNDVWFSFVADGSTMIVEFLNVVSAPYTPSGAIIQSIEVYSGSCGALTSVVCDIAGTAGYYEITGLTDGATYYIRNKSNSAGAYAQNYDISLKTPPAPPANDECNNATVLLLSTDNTCDNKLTGTTIGATISVDNSCNTTQTYRDVWNVFTPTESAYYEFKYTKLITSPASYYTVFEGTCGALTNKSGTCTSTSNQILYLTGGQPYYVMVTSSTIGPGINYELCVWQLPPAQVNSDCSGALTLTESSDSSGANKISGNLDNSYYSPEGCASSTNESVWYAFTPNYTGEYNFNLTKITGGTPYFSLYSGGCAGATVIDFKSGASCFKNGAQTVDLVAGTTYLLMVYASTATSFEVFAYPDPALSTESIEFESFKYYPNPVLNTLTVEAKNSMSNISIINIVGQEVKRVVPNNLKTTIEMNSLNNGIYFVKVSINNAQKTFKIIKK